MSIYPAHSIFIPLLLHHISGTGVFLLLWHVSNAKPVQKNGRVLCYPMRNKIKED